MQAINNRIIIGNDREHPILEFQNDHIKSVNSDASVSLVGEELYIDQLNAELDYYVWEPYVINPADAPGAEYGPYSGDVVTFRADNAGAVTEGEISIDAEQDLNGYAAPWPPGGGTNKFDKDHAINSTHTSSIATALSTYKSTGEYATGYTTNATSLSNNSQYCTTFTPCASGTTYTTKNLTSGSNLASINFIDDSGTVVSHNSSWSNQAWTHTATATEKYIMVCAKVAELGNVMIVEGSTMPSTWTPYSNICPISGRTGANIVVSPTLDAQDGTVYPISWQTEAGTVYGGTLNVLTGELKSRPHYASYNGEALVGPWVSSMDVYAPGTTPTIGAEVVDLGGIVSTYQLTPPQIQTLAGENNIWSDTGSITGLKALVGGEYDAFVSSDGYILCSKKNYDLRQLPYGTMITYYANSQIAGTFYAKTVSRVGRARYKVNAVSAIGLLDKQYHKGGVYQGAYFQDVVEEILGNDFEYIVDGDVSRQTVYGWLPYDTKRKNLYQLLLAYGVEIVLGDNGAMFFTFPQVENPFQIPTNRVFGGGSVIYDEPASVVEVNEHSFHYDSGMEEQILFDNSADAAVDHSMIIFSDPIYPASIYCADGNLTIHESAANYAAVSGTGVLKGKPYVHNIRLISQTNERTQVEKVVSVQNATLISFVNADNVLARLSEYYFNSIRVEQDVVIETEKPGQLYTTDNPYGERITGYIVKMTKAVTSLARAKCRFLLNYVPVGSGASYFNRVLIPLGENESYTWEIPEYVFEKDVPTFRVTLIGRGYNGEDGQPGETPTDTPDRAVKGANGGIGGLGGNGGKILTVTIDATGLTEITVANDGEDSVLTSTLYNYSSASGASNSFGYFDAFVQTSYALPGENGVQGGKGGDGDYYTHSRAAEATMTDGESVTYKGVTYNGGAYSGRNVINGRSVFPNSQYSGNLTLYTAGAGGGGAAVGSDGGDAFAANTRPAQDWWNWGKGGDGADGANADPTGSVYGNGGGGGHGGGGGGGGACWESWNHEYSSVIGTGNKGSGTGGNGGQGGVGNYGCAIIYY